MLPKFGTVRFGKQNEEFGSVLVQKKIYKFGTMLKIRVRHITSYDCTNYLFIAIITYDLQLTNTFLMRSVIGNRHK